MAEVNIDVLLSMIGDDDVRRRLTDLRDDLDVLDDRGSITDALGGADAIDRGATGLQRMGNAANILVGAVGVIAASEMTQQFFDLWRNSNDYEATATAFERLTTNLGGANKVLQEWSTATKGAIDNEALMEAGNKLLANTTLTSANLGEMLNTARVIGGEGADSITQFADAFADRSWDRLRDFGLDVDRAKERVDQLTEQGATIQEAFDLAVWEGMADAAERLGPGLTGMVEPITAIATQAKNIKDSALGAFFQTLDEGLVAGWQLLQIPGLMNTANEQRQGRIAEATDIGRIEQLAQLFANADPDAVGALGGEQTLLNMEAIARAAAVFGEENGRGVESVEELEAVFGRTFGLVNFQFDEATARMANFYLGWQYQQEQMALRMQILGRDDAADSVENTGIPGLGDMTTGAVPPGIAATETSVSYSRQQVDEMATRLEELNVGELEATLVINDVRVAAQGWQTLRDQVRTEVVAVLGTVVADNGGRVPGEDPRRTNGPQ